MAKRAVAAPMANFTVSITARGENWMSSPPEATTAERLRMASANCLVTRPTLVALAADKV